MKIKRIAHLGVAIKDLDSPKKLYGDNLHLEFKGDEVVGTQKVQVSFFFKVGESSIELPPAHGRGQPGGQIPGDQGRGLSSPGPGGGGYRRRVLEEIRPRA